jgi:hypothetical protein
MTDVVALPKAVESGSVYFQQGERAIDGLEFVKVDQEVEDSVEKFVPLGCQSPMKDPALVEAGM